MGYDPAIVAAFLDGTLDEMTARRIARETLSDPVLAAEIKARRRQLSDKRHRDGSELGTTLAAVSGRADSGRSDRQGSRARRTAWWRRPMSIGLLLIVSALSFWLGKSQWFAPQALIVDHGHLVAVGALAEALDNASTSAAPGRDGFRIRMTFLNGDGLHCRDFEIHDLNGIACRTGGHWQIKWALAADRTRPIASLSAALADAQTELRATRAFTRAQEDAARRERWAE